MVMKVFNKGQVVIPAKVRKALGIAIGDLMDVVVNEESKTIELSPHVESKSQMLAGSLSKYSTQLTKPKTVRKKSKAVS